MPRSKKRKNHHDFHPPVHTEKARKNKSAVLVSIIFLGLIGIGIAYFAAGPSPLWLAGGAIAGGLGGYYFARQLDKSFSKK